MGSTPDRFIAVKSMLLPIFAMAYFFPGFFSAGFALNSPHQHPALVNGKVPIRLLSAVGGILRHSFTAP